MSCLSLFPFLPRCSVASLFLSWLLYAAIQKIAQSCRFTKLNFPSLSKKKSADIFTIAALIEISRMLVWSEGSYETGLWLWIYEIISFNCETQNILNRKYLKKSDRSQSFTELHIGTGTSCVSDKQTLPPGLADTQTPPPEAFSDGLMHICCGGWMKGVSHKHKLLCRMSHSYCGKTQGCWSWPDRNVGRLGALKWCVHDVCV